MSVIFLHSNEVNWEENFNQAKKVFGKCKLVNGSSCRNIKEAYQLILSNADRNFIMIEGDNFVFDTARNINLDTPSKFKTLNKFGIRYHHGGIKVLNKEETILSLNSSHILENFEISGNLNLFFSEEILSEHRFDWSEKNEWKTIAKELTKLYIWGKRGYLDHWLNHEKPRQIFEQILPEIHKQSFSSLFNDFFNSFDLLYYKLNENIT